MNEYLETQNDANLDQIHGLEKQLSIKEDLILEFQHKYETLQKTETKQNSLIEEKQDELKNKLNENQDLKSMLSKLELEQKSLNETVQRLTNQTEELSGVKTDLGMVSHKMSLITIFGHKHKIKNFNGIWILVHIWNQISYFEAKILQKYR